MQARQLSPRFSAACLISLQAYRAMLLRRRRHRRLDELSRALTFTRSVATAPIHSHCFRVACPTPTPLQPPLERPPSQASPLAQSRLSLWPRRAARPVAQWRNDLAVVGPRPAGLLAALVRLHLAWGQPSPDAGSEARCIEPQALCPAVVQAHQIPAGANRCGMPAIMMGKTVACVQGACRAKQGRRCRCQRLPVARRSLPPTHLPSLVMRLLDRAAAVCGLEAMGMVGEAQSERPHTTAHIDAPTHPHAYARAFAHTDKRRGRHAEVQVSPPPPSPPAPMS